MCETRVSRRRTLWKPVSTPTSIRSHSHSHDRCGYHHQHQPIAKDVVNDASTGGWKSARWCQHIHSQHTTRKVLKCSRLCNAVRVCRELALVHDHSMFKMINFSNICIHVNCNVLPFRRTGGHVNCGHAHFAGSTVWFSWWSTQSHLHILCYSISYCIS